MTEIGYSVSLDRQLLAFPLLADARLAFYRCDLLLKAGVVGTRIRAQGKGTSQVEVCVDLFSGRKG